MNFDEYQEAAVKTAIFPKESAIEYVTLGLVNEAGEVAGKVKKVIRDNEGHFTKEKIEELGAELGDVLWYIAAMCQEIGISMDSVALENILKLRDRQQRGVLGGSGDKR